MGASTIDLLMLFSFAALAHCISRHHPSHCMQNIIQYNICRDSHSMMNSSTVLVGLAERIAPGLRDLPGPVIGLRRLLLEV